MIVTKNLRISGRVQGVGFRDFMQRRARALGVTGWVRNRMDGSVEAVVQGSTDAVDQMIALARQGPRSAHVTGVRVSDADGQFTAFEMRPTEWANGGGG
jgi:acylphosphatase